MPEQREITARLLTFHLANYKSPNFFGSCCPKTTMLRRNINWVSYPSTTILPKLMVHAEFFLNRAAAQCHTAATIYQNALNHTITPAVLNTTHRLIQAIEQKQTKK